MSQSRSATGAHRKGEAASDGDAACWHYAVNGEHFGPYTEGEMVELFISRELNDETFIWRKGYTRWQPATAEPVFARAIAGERPAAASAHTIQPSAAQVTEGSGRLTIEVRRPGATISESAEKRGAIVTDDVDDAFDSLFGSSAARKDAASETGKDTASKTRTAPATTTQAKASTTRTPSPSAGSSSRSTSTTSRSASSRSASAGPSASATSAPAGKNPVPGRPSRSTSHLKTSDSLAERLRKLREAREAEAAGDKAASETEPEARPSAPQAKAPSAAKNEESTSALTAEQETAPESSKPTSPAAEVSAATPSTEAEPPAGEASEHDAHALYDDDEVTEHYQEASRPLYDDEEDTAIYAEDEATPTTVVSDPESHARQQEATLGRSLHDEFAARDSERRRIAMSRDALADYDPTEDGGKSLEAPPYVLPPVGSEDEEEPLPAVMIEERKNRIRIAVLITLLVFLALVMVALLLVRGGEKSDADTAERTEEAPQNEAAADQEDERLEAILRQNQGLARSRALRTVGEALSNSERDSYRQAQELAGRAETARRPSSASTRTVRSATTGSGGGDTNSRAAAMGFQLDPSRAPQINVGARDEEPTGPSASHFAATMGSTVQTSINRCTQRHRALSGSLNFSRVELQVSVAPDGSVEGLSVQRDIRDSAFANCLRSESSRWRFEPFEGSTQRIGRNFIVR